MYDLLFLRPAAKFATLLIAAAFSFSASSSYAQLTVYEGFDYNAGSTLPGSNSGSGFSGAWTSDTSASNAPDYEVQAGSISFSGLETSGGHVVRPNRTGIVSNSRVLGAASVSALTADNTTLWGSFLYRHGNGNGFLADSSINLASTTTSDSNNHQLSTAGEGFGVIIGENNDEVEAIFYDNSTLADETAGTTVSAVSNSTSLFVFRVVWNPNGTDDVLNVYEITDVAAPLPAPFSTARFDFSSVEQAALNTLNVLEAQTGEFDEIRFGATLEDVLPVGNVDPGDPEDPPISDGPNIIYIIVDDMGYSDVGAFGGEIDTPNIDSMAAEGMSFRQFYNNSKCETTRTSVMSGLYHGRGANAIGGATLAEALGTVGYRNYAVGKWHLGTGSLIPVNQGFDNFYGFYSGSSRYFPSGINANSIKRDAADPNNLISSYANSFYNTSTGTSSSQTSYPSDFYLTDAFGDNAVTFIQDAVTNHPERPFFMYLSFNAPHTPLQAPVDLINKYRNNGTYDDGWDQMRIEKWQRLQALGLVDPAWKLPELRNDTPQWADLTAAEQEAEKHRRAVYAAMMDSVDQNVGKVLQQLDASGIADDTLIIFTGDNGAQAFDNTPNKNNPLSPSDPDSLWSMGPAWAAHSNIPFRYYKQSQHQGGICTPFIARWPSKIAPGVMTDQPGHVVDMMATFVDIADADYDSLTKNDGSTPVPPMDGASLLPIFEGGTRPAPDFWGFEFNRSEFGVIQGDWKLVAFSSSPWRLYNLTDDRTETDNLRFENPDKVLELAALYDQWAIDTYGDTSRTYAERDERGELSQEMRYSRVLSTGQYSVPGVDVSLDNIGSGQSSSMDDHWEFYRALTSASGIDGNSDSVTFANKVIDGDGQVTAVVESMSNVTADATAGVMFRGSNDSDSPLVMIGVQPNGDLVQSVRTAEGAAVTTITFPSASISLPAFFKITREGNQFLPCYSTDSLTWSSLPPVTVNLDTEAIAGLSAASGDNSTRATITFREWDNEVADVEDCVLGDVNGDGTVNFLDISPFISMISTGTFVCEADINGDGIVNFLDISPFIALLN